MNLKQLTEVHKRKVKCKLLHLDVVAFPQNLAHLRALLACLLLLSACMNEQRENCWAKAKFNSAKTLSLPLHRSEK